MRESLLNLMVAFWYWRLRKVREQLMVINTLTGNNKPATQAIVKLGSLLSKKKFQYHSHGFTYFFLNCKIVLKKRDGFSRFTFFIDGRERYNHYPYFESEEEVIDRYLLEECLLSKYFPKLKKERDELYERWEL